jgi:hypothetical protein
MEGQPWPNLSYMNGHAELAGEEGKGKRGVGGGAAMVGGRGAQSYSYSFSCAYCCLMLCAGRREVKREKRERRKGREQEKEKKKIGKKLNLKFFGEKIKDNLWDWSKNIF